MSEVDCQPTSTVEQVPVGLEPLGLAGSWKPTVGDHDVRQVAGGGKWAFFDPLLVPTDQQVPGPAPAVERNRAELRAATGAGPIGHGDDLTRHAGQLGQGLASERIAAFSK